MASDETRKSHQKEKEKIGRVKGKRGEEKKNSNGPCALIFYVVFERKKTAFYFSGKGYFLKANDVHFSDSKLHDEICCNFIANNSLYCFVSLWLFWESLSEGWASCAMANRFYPF